MRKEGIKMLKRIMMIIGVFLITGFANGESVSKNLVKNGNFEKGRGYDSASPAHWLRIRSTKDTAYRDFQSPYKGEASLTVKNVSGKGWQIIQQKLEYKPDTSYQVTFYGKTNETEEMLSGIVNIGGDEILTMGTFGHCFFDSKEWQKYSFTFRTPAEPNQNIFIRIASYPYDVEKGQIWVDEVCVLPIGKGEMARHEEPRLVPTGAVNIFNTTVSFNPGERKEWKISLPKVKDKEVILELKARLHTDKFLVGGGTGALKISVNKTPLDVKNLSHGKASYTFADGRTQSTYRVSGFTLTYASDFVPMTKDCRYYPVDLPGHNPYLFRFRITDLVKEGTNTISMHNAARVRNPMVIAYAIITLEDKEGKGDLLARKPPEKKEANLPYIAPKRVTKTPYKIEMTEGGGLKLSLKGSTYIVTSSYSLIPGWAKLGEKKSSNFNNLKIERNLLLAETASFSLKREITEEKEGIEIADTLTNKTDENLPVMVRHQTNIPEVTEFRLGGLINYLKRAFSSEPKNPTTICITSKGSLGFLPLDDVFRVHIRNFAVNNFYGIADNNLVIKPKGSITLKFGVFPSEEKDYYSQINIMRRHLGVNFEIDGPQIFAAFRSPEAVWSYTGEKFPITTATPDKDIRKQILNKGAKFVCVGSGGGIAFPQYKGAHPFGNAWLYVVNPQRFKSFVDRIKKAVPEVKTTIYFNCFLSNKDGDSEKYSESRSLNIDGSQAGYGKYPIFNPTSGSAYGKMQAKIIDIILDEIGADGIYWDESEYSTVYYHYGKPWDGVSADIDPVSHKIKRLKSSVILITQPWRTSQIEKILNKKKVLIANFPPTTITMLKYKFPRFTETGSITHCYTTHLYTPIGLGDHMTEKNEKDAYRKMIEFLDYGSLYYWYYEGIWAPYPTLTSYMFPTTPVEIHSGYILGKERIITKKSGYFSFGDNSEADAHLFDEEGKEIKRDISSVKRDGKTYYKVELGEFESCVLIKKGRGK